MEKQKTEAEELDAIDRELQGVDTSLAAQLALERAGRRPAMGELEGIGETLQTELERLYAIEERLRSWACGSAGLERIATIAAENRGLATDALARLREARDAGYEHDALHGARDALLHTSRCTEELLHLETEARQTLRQRDRLENRRDFLSG